MLNHKFGCAKYYLRFINIGFIFKEKSSPLDKESFVHPLFEEIEFQITKSLKKIHYYNTIPFIYI